ncbi:type II toxin-antitoxin system MqsA family antitoxin [Trichlorobacter lovleyi]|uniref:type II toxin-antitoxin system MqsA family antitoxin n=1 Tax=Trichlorobacter lovleyi TaxID=313985 RepID=UPI00223F6931|nr:type II toxin-antitoxin system MqsA family antitoxin [Trichlorobacter lovleyi]QOX78275.1 type II toxin-antitoxin system MqsA family antitoxin [Trichlorobacter lovleyi]
MICTNCFNADYKTSTTDLTVTVNGESHLLRDLACETCPACGEVTFTHGQSLEIDKQRVALEFGLKPLLTPEQLKTVRRVLNMKLDEICDLLQIGRNSYGRWERGEVAITPSMNLLVHNFIEKFPDAKVNLIPSERIAAISKVNSSLLDQYLSFGEYIREVINATRLLPDLVCASLEIEPAILTRIENNDFAPEQISPDVTARIVQFFGLTLDNLKRLLNATLSIVSMKNSATVVHARSTSYDAKGAAAQSRTVNMMLEKLAQKRGESAQQKLVSDDYLVKVQAALDALPQAGGTR